MVYMHVAMTKQKHFFKFVAQRKDDHGDKHQHDD